MEREIKRDRHYVHIYQYMFVFFVLISNFGEFGRKNDSCSLYNVFNVGESTTSKAKMNLVFKTLCLNAVII